MRAPRGPALAVLALAVLALVGLAPVGLALGCGGGEAADGLARSTSASGAPAATSDLRSADLRSADLAGDVVVQVGSRLIAASAVHRIAAAQSISSTEARSRAVRDALFAEEARARGKDAASAETAALARALAAELRRDAEGPVTDAELERVTERHWRELRRPEAFRVVHAVVRAPIGPDRQPVKDAATWARIDALASAIDAAAEAVSARARAEPRVAGAKDPAGPELERVVSGVPTGGLEVKVEVLDPVAADGRSFGGGGLVREFSSAVSALRARGDRTPPFRTVYGAHVAVLLERIAPFEVPEAKRRELVAPEVLDDRIRAARTAILESGAAQVEFPPNAAALLDLVRVQP